eukprot:CAMPEP_0172402298 /NCGR_PEP_ID=MMETSP1061-20121228/53848_1 /TAXON_ID=37318 /ORGANISM="Pseudo-nitzschia pungens, Strain cf. pungens" /LENGTH=274 /DNA_ID=CAMNT_0013136217 /DNA_START=183 /DNA_END=1007 /DNA_ORIENTATION=+
MSKRSLNELLKSQDLSTDSPLGRVLKLNQELEALRERNSLLEDENENLIAKNETLVTERSGLVQVVKDIKKELDDLKISSMATEKNLRAELRSMQASWNSLYEEQRAAKERYQRELQQQSQQQQPQQQKTKPQESTEVDKGMSLPSSLEDQKPRSQKDMISSAMKKQISTPKDTADPIERKLQELKDENMNLKSALVKLRTQYREEKYRSKHPVSPASTASVSDLDSIEEKKSSPPGLFLSLSRRNLVGRSFLVDSSADNSSISKSTRNLLWGK